MSIHDEAEKIRRKLDEENSTTVSVALFGQPGAGKSSLINKIVGKKVAEVGVETDKTVEAASYEVRLFMRSGVLRQENRKQGVQGCLAASSDVVQALKEGQVEGEFFLGNPPVWAQPGAQQRPKSLHRVDVNLMKPVTVLIACVFARPVVDAFVCIAPLL